MNSWPPEYDLVHENWHVTNDEEYSYDEQNVPGTKSQNGNGFINKEQYDKEKFIDSDLNKINRDQSMSSEKNKSTLSQRKKDEEKHINDCDDAKTIQKTTEQDVVSENDVIIAFQDEDNELINRTSEATNSNEKNEKLNGKQSEFDFRNEIRGNNNTSCKNFAHNSHKPTHEPRSDNPLIRDPHIKTLGDALKYFKLYSKLRLFEDSLEDVRRNKKKKEKHESELKQFDKEIQKLSFKFHPDKVKHRGGSEEDIAVAQKLQTALNATRTVLNVLNTIFLEDINMDHHYGYYTKLNISSLGNEDEVKNHVCEVIYKISFISEIKQRNIIAEIQQFLIESKSCVENFFRENVSGFERCRNSAFFHLKKCIKGYKKLLAEFKEVEEECMSENLENINALLKKLSSNSSRNMGMLKEIKKIAKKSLTGTCHFYSTLEYIDDYFVLPFAIYINVIVMCNVMLKNENQTFWGNLYTSHSEPAYNHSTSFLVYLYYLASYFSGNKQYKNVVERTLGPNHLYNEEIKKEFRTQLQQLMVYLDDRFKVDNYYVENRRGNYLIDEYKKCMKMMADFKKKEKELKNDIKKLECRNQEIEDKYDEAMKLSEEINNKTEERLAQIKLLREKISVSLQSH